METVEYHDERHAALFADFNRAIDRVASQEVGTCPATGGIRCSASVINAASGSSGNGLDGAAARYMGQIDTLEFQTLCGDGGACRSNQACVERIVNYCLNPANTNILSGEFQADNPASRSMFDFPIFHRQDCRDAIRNLIAETKRAITRGTPGATQAAGYLHQAITNFCSVYGTSKTNASPYVAYSRYLEPSTFIKRLTERQKRNEVGDGTPTHASTPTFRLRGVPFGTDFNARDILEEETDVLVLSVDIPAGTPKPVVYDDANGVQSPYAPRMVVTFNTRVTGQGSPVDVVATNGFKLFAIAQEFIGGANRVSSGSGEPAASSRFVIRSDVPRRLTVRIGGEERVVHITPEITGRVVDATVDEETGRATLSLVDVYTNTAEFYSGGDTNCGCFVPFDATDNVQRGNPDANNTPNPGSQARAEGLACRYGWNQIPSPTLKTTQYNKAGFGRFQVLFFKDLDLLNTKLPSSGIPSTRTQFDIRIESDNGRLTQFVPNGSFEISGVAGDNYTFLLDFCACHMPSGLYSKFYKFLSESGVRGQKHPGVFPGCANSSFPTLDAASPRIAGTSSTEGLSCAPDFEYDSAQEAFSTGVPTICPRRMPEEGGHDEQPTDHYMSLVTIAAVGSLAVFCLVIVMFTTFLRSRRIATV